VTPIEDDAAMLPEGRGIVLRPSSRSQCHLPDESPGRSPLIDVQ
jgi:hypothetical protein